MTIHDEYDTWEIWDDEPTTPFEWLRTARVLVAEDDTALREMIATRLRADGCDVVEAHDGDSALEVITAIDGGSSKHRALDLAVIDVRMPGLSGLEVVRLLRSWRWTTPVLFVTAYPDAALLEQARELGANVLAKPFVLSRLSRAATSTLAGRPS